MSQRDHKAVVQAEFARQASSLARSAHHRDPRHLDSFVDFSRLAADEAVVDVACGPGLVIGALLKRSRHVAGVELTRQMLLEARHQLPAGNNVSLVCGDADYLPFRTAGYDLAVSRFAFHHMENPNRVLGEMVRIIRPGGRVAVLDHLSCDDPVKAAYHNEIEIWRDPSHVRCLIEAEMRTMFQAAGLRIADVREGLMDMDFDEWSARTFQSAERTNKARTMLLDSVQVDRSGLNARFDGRQIGFSYRTLMVLGVM